MKTRSGGKNIQKMEKNKKIEKTFEITEMVDCGICLDRPKEIGKMDKCQHIFCFSCIKSWSDIHNHCPYCNVQFATIAKISYLEKGVVKLPARNHIVRVKNKDERTEVWNDIFYEEEYDSYNEYDEEEDESDEEEEIEEEDEEKPDWAIAFHCQYGFYPLTEEWAIEYSNRHPPSAFNSVGNAPIELSSDEEDEDEEDFCVYRGNNQVINLEDEEEEYDEVEEEEPDWIVLDDDRNEAPNQHIRFEDEDQKAKHIRFEDKNKHIRFSEEEDSDGSSNMQKKRSNSSSEESSEEELPMKRIRSVRISGNLPRK
eukprot:TRINITY_DN2631_c0_g1_i1.p1 TRINITY_DN2631_c0_g1~~TRINITY_DN2631_c0_g1_i1.p1  ORF type:complete len:312 (-),score=126.06 TRINITY_DN2631_c0_g1_i1:285-1220(-)